MKNTFVTFIGAGNLAWHLAPALDNTEFSVREVYSRDPQTALTLVKRLYDAEVATSLDFSDSPSRIFVLAIPDDAIELTASALQLPSGAVVVHTSGSQPLSLLYNIATPLVGVFYPLQTFSKAKKVAWDTTPIFVESLTPEVESLLMKMGKALTPHIHKIKSSDRKAMHVAAVVASNFTNHLLYIAKKIMQENHLNYDWLKPLIAETITKSLSIGPEKAQTGPAKRGDLEILDKHVAFLSEDESLTELYRVISQHIVDTYHA
jgi:predicted short-subunit dehydrogenase-like oxidoreductase (DUF2520 family)